MNESKRNLLILGAGGHGQVLAETAFASGKWSKIAFLDDKYPALTSAVVWPIEGKIVDANKFLDMYSCAAVGIGDNGLRLNLIKKLSHLGFDLPVIAHPSSIVSLHAKVEDGTVLFAHTTINIGSKIGMGCIVNTGASIDHDCLLGDGVHVSPGARLAGNVKIGNESWIGIGSTIIETKSIGRKVIIGAGAVVINDIPDGVIAVGVPAKIKNY